MANIPLHLQGLALACPLCEAGAFLASTERPASDDVICCAACGGRYTYGFLLKRIPAGSDEKQVANEAISAKQEQPSRDVSANPEHARNDPARLTEYLVKEIAKAAYFRAQNRDFAPGHEKQDWFEAESTMLHTRSTHQSTGSGV